MHGVRTFLEVSKQTCHVERSLYTSSVTHLLLRGHPRYVQAQLDTSGHICTLFDTSRHVLFTTAQNGFSVLALPGAWGGGGDSHTNSGRDARRTS